MVVLADKNYDQHELNVTLEQLKKHGFALVITSARKGKLHSRYNSSGNNGHVTIKQALAEVSGQEYFSVVLMTGEASNEFKGKTPVGRQLQHQLRKTLAMHGSIVGMGAAQAIVTDESISGPIHYEDCDGLCIGDLKKGPGNVIKVAEFKQIPKMAWQLNTRFEEAKKKLSKK